MKYSMFIFLIMVAAFNGRADDFGSGANEFEIEFALIGNAGNGADINGYGDVAYYYNMGKYEVTVEQFSKAQNIDNNISDGDEAYWNALGDWAPACNVSWQEAAKFCNWLTSNDAELGAYTVSGGVVTGVDRASALGSYTTVYVIPNEDEWYKAAYHTGSGYSAYANGTSTIPVKGPTGANYDYVYPAPGRPWLVWEGSGEQNGTYNMNGNMWEILEDGVDLLIRGGAFDEPPVGRKDKSDEFFEAIEVGFRVASIAKIIPLNEAARIYCSSIVGSWYMKDKAIPSHDNVALTFLTNGTYFFAQDGDPSFDPPGAVGMDGMEKGTYTWDSVSGAFSAVVLEDTCGEWGLSHPGGSVTVNIDGDTLSYMANGTAVLHRVSYPTTPPSIVGGWMNGNDVAITFLENGIYYLSHADTGANATGWPGMERGTYSWDPVSGAFSVTALVDTTGDWGLSSGGGSTPGMTAAVSGNTIHFVVPGDGTFDLTRVIDPLCSDLDGDGLPDVWEQQYFSNPTNATAAGHGDSDTLDNRSEYIAGTIPNDGASVFEVSDTGSSPSGFVLNWSAVEGRSYSVSWTDSLTNGLSSIATDLTYPQNSYTDTVHSAEGEGFYSIDVNLEN